MTTHTDDRDPWVGTAEIAGTLGCSRRLVQMSLADPARANATYGPGMWTDHAKGPLAVRKVYAVRRSALKKLSRGTP